MGTPPCHAPTHPQAGLLLGLGLLVGPQVVQGAGDSVAVGYLVSLPARAVQTLGLDRLGRACGVGVHTEKQRIQLLIQFLDRL